MSLNLYNKYYIIYYLYQLLLQKEIFFLEIFIEMQRRRAEKILTMFPPCKDSSESSDDDSVESYHSIGEILCESPLPIEAIENDVDELLRDIELNPIDEVILFTL